jgi:hypothetical protein
MDTQPQFWKRCSTCKKEIAFSSPYFICSVSTCRQGRGALQFCSSDCWDAHLGFARHREAWAEDACSPSREEFLASGGTEEPRAPVRKIVEPRQSTPLSVGTSADAPVIPDHLETLVVVSKVKQLIRERSDFNTSQCCIDALTKKVAEAALRGIEEARSLGRRTVMGRDIK